MRGFQKLAVYCRKSNNRKNGSGPKIVVEGESKGGSGEIENKEDRRRVRMEMND